MDSYTITITPDDDSGNSTTLTVDVSTGAARITSVHMRAPAGLTGGQAPGVDVGLLLQAVTGPTHTPAAITASPTPEAKEVPQPAPAHADPKPTGAGVDEPPATATAAAPQPATPDSAAPPSASAAAPARRTGTRRAAGARTAGSRPAKGQAAPSSGARRRRTEPAPKAAAKAAPRKAAGKQADAAASNGAERAYRRMPNDFAAVYRQAGTAAAIADHYGVPRHTAQGWIGRHKKQNPDATH